MGTRSGKVIFLGRPVSRAETLPFSGEGREI
jgi:hypothetical protein